MDAAHHDDDAAPALNAGVAAEVETDAAKADRAVAAWQRFVQAYAKFGSGTPLKTRTARDGVSEHDSVGPPASEQAIAALEAVFGRPIHPELRAVLGIADGADVRVGEYHHLYPCGDIARHTAFLRDFAKAEYADVYNAPNGEQPPNDRCVGVKYSFWREGWLAIGGDDMGNVLVMDYDPDLANGGVVGQILDRDRVDPECPRHATSLAEYLVQCAEEIETGKVVWDKEYSKTMRILNRSRTVRSTPPRRVPRRVSAWRYKLSNSPWSTPATGLRGPGHSRRSVADHHMLSLT